MGLKVTCGWKDCELWVEEKRGAEGKSGEKQTLPQPSPCGRGRRDTDEHEQARANTDGSSQGAQRCAPTPTGTPPIGVEMHPLP